MSELKDPLIQQAFLMSQDVHKHPGRPVCPRSDSISVPLRGMAVSRAFLSMSREPQWHARMSVSLESVSVAADHKDLQLRNLAGVSHVRAPSRWAECTLLLERADSDEPLCTQFHRESMPSRRAVVQSASTL